MGVLDGRIAIVTGGANGIGRACAARFAGEGARVVIADTDRVPGEALTAEIASHGGTAMFVHTNVALASDMRALIDRTVERFGGLNIMLNNAGIEGASAPIAEYDLEEFDRVVAVNLRGVFLGMQYALRHMIPAGGGVILNMASVAGLQGYATLAPYVATKHAVVGLTKSAALECAAHRVRVNALCPGAIVTDMIHRIANHDPVAEEGFAKLQPIGRMGTPEEMADAALFLCSDASAFLTGVALPADGGIMAG